MPESIEEEIKISERDKNLAEIRKSEAEREKIEFELSELKKEATKDWWRTKSFRQQVIAVVLGLSFLGFYISTVIVPTATRDNLLLGVDNAKAMKKLLAEQDQLTKDSDNIKLQEIDLRRQKHYNDSLRKNLDVVGARVKILTANIELLKTHYDSLNKIYSNGTNKSVKAISLEKKISEINKTYQSAVNNYNEVESASSNKITATGNVHLTILLNDEPTSVKVRITGKSSSGKSVQMDLIPGMSGDGDMIPLPIGKYKIELLDNHYQIVTYKINNPFIVEKSKIVDVDIPIIELQK